ncbi:MAG: hypothetical protein NTU60_11525 [Candidatus Aminicenantes bacterium]|nr:hypothetical protein [Candidatus Aminicenantes bacterium]
MSKSAARAKIEKIDHDGPLVRIKLAGEGEGMITQSLPRQLRPFLLFWA